MTYTGKVRSRDPESSWDAAARQTESRVTAVQTGILAVLRRYGPLSDEQIADRYEAMAWLDPDMPKATGSSLRTRRKELELAGRVTATGTRVRTRTGSTAMTWRAVVR
jgi:hypothetical protein